MLTAFAEQVINGLMLGSVYVFVALGMMLIYGVMHVLNFAHGALFTLGAYVALLVFTRIVDNYLVAILAACLVLVVVGAVLERAVFAPLRDNLRNQVIASLGLVLVIQNGIIALLGPNALRFPVEATRATVGIGPLFFAVQHLLIIAVGLVSVALLFAFLRFTRQGTALRAVAQNPRGALVVGIDVAAVHRMAFALSMILAAVGGAMLGPLFLVFPGMGDLPLVKGLAGIVLGGMGSIGGAVVGGLAIGIIEATSTLVVPTDYRDVVVFGLIVLVLLIRPRGLFGTATRDEA